MTDNDNVFVFIGAYGSTAAAWEDYDSVKELHSRGVIDTYDAAIVNKDTDGKVHVLQREASGSVAERDVAKLDDRRHGKPD